MLMLALAIDEWLLLEGVMIFGWTGKGAVWVAKVGKEALLLVIFGLVFYNFCLSSRIAFTVLGGPTAGIGNSAFV